MQQPRVLFLCTANSARSLMAEAILKHFAGNDVEVTSAGTLPTRPESEALAALERLGIATEGLHSKALNDIDVHAFDYVISLCDQARAECHSLFVDQRFIAWDFPDPVATRTSQAFKRTAHELVERIKMLLLILRKKSDRAQLFDAPHAFFKVLADPLRLHIIVMLQHFGELCVYQFVQATGMSQPKVSRHLAQLREYGLLADRKDQRWVYYRINPALQDWMKKIIDTTAMYHTSLIPQHVTWSVEFKNITRESFSQH